MIDRQRMALRVNVLIVTGTNKRELFDFASKENFKQFSFSVDENNWVLSAPLDDEARIRYAWLYHRTKGLDKAKE